MIMFNIRFLPANNAWAILFGRDVFTATILALCETKREAQETLTSWGR
jgi:hypothetical protein